jgi:hypothetical protein
MSFLSCSGGAALIVCLLVAGSAGAEPQTTDIDNFEDVPAAGEQDRPPTLPAGIWSVASGGYWEDGERSGTLRVIVVNRGQEQVSSLVYLEWLQERLGEPSQSVAHAPVAAINDGARWSVDTPLLRPSETGVVVELSAVELGSYEERRFVLTVPVKGVGRFDLQ